MDTIVTVKQASALHDFQRHLDALLEEAEVREETTLAENVFVTLKKGTDRIHTYYSAGRGEIRTVICPLASHVPLLPQDAFHERKNPTALYQIDLDNRRIDCGMSYVFHLGDGRFFLIDGGYFTNNECNRLYTLLRTIQPQGQLTVAGWFFSHAHQDHMGCFLDFITKYRTEVAIEGLYYTFPSLSLPEAVFWKQSDNATMREFAYTLSRVLPTVPHVSLHTGQRFSIADLSFEVLFTHEDIYPERIGSFNDTSTVLRVYAAGQTILFLGDLQDASCRKLEAMYGTYLKSDLVQVAHHGFNGSTIETYDLVSPTVALWPTADYGFNGNRQRKVNAHLLEMTCVKEHLIAGIHGTRRLLLPYRVETSEAIDLPKEK